MKKYLHVVECAIEYDGRFLVIQRPQGSSGAGLLSLPGGKVDPEDEVFQDDILRNATKREVFEEVGLILKDPIEYVFSSYFEGKNDIPIMNSTFYCLIQGSIPTIEASPREVANYFWMTPTEITQAQKASGWLKRYITLIENYKAKSK